MTSEKQFPEGAVMVFGATGGIGKVVAYEFAKAGTPVAIMWRSKKDDADELAQKIEAAGQKGEHTSMRRDRARRAASRNR